MTAPLAPAPGYYPDPLDPAGERWWDGAGWTDTVRTETPAAAQPVDAEPVDDSGGESPADPDLVVPGLAPDPLPAVAPVTAVPVAVPAVTADAEVVPEMPAAAAAAAPAADEPPAATGVPAGYYPDPYGQAPLRWWDGTQWTVQTSRPDAVEGTAPPTAQPGGQAPDQPANQPPDQAASRTATTTVLPGAARGSSGGFRPGQPVRTGWRLPARSLVAALVLLVGIGVRAYFWFDSPSDQQPAGASLAAAVNLRQGDLPKGFVEQQANAAAAGTATGSTSAEATIAAAQQEFDRAVNRCIGAADTATSVAFAAASPMFARAGTEVSSDVSVVRTEAVAAQDLRAHQSAAAPGCVGKVGTKPLRTILDGRGVTLTALSVTRLPGVPKDAFGLRTRMTMAADGRTMTVFSDTYGFVRRNVEVGLTVSRAGAAPDPAVAATALRQLQARAQAAVPLDRQ